MARRVVSSHGDAGREAGQGSGSRKPRTTADRASSSGAEANRVAVTRERQTRKKPRTASNDVSRKAASGKASPGRTTVGKATGRQMTSGRKSEKALEKETSRQAKGGKTVSRKSRFGKTVSRSVSSSSSRSVSRAEGFVDARRLHSEEVVKKTLDENVGVLGVATRPKVLDFDARLKERKKAGTRVAAIRVLIVILAAALVSALIWLLLFSSVFRLETSQISVRGGNEWVSEKDVLDTIDAIVLDTLYLQDLQPSQSLTYSVTAPEGTTLAENVGPVTVTIVVAGVTERNVTVTAFNCENVPEGFSAVPVTESLNILLRGLESEMAQITAEDLRITVDLSGITEPGVHTVPVTVQVANYANVGVKGSYQIVVDVERLP